jgi:RNA polymerase sigma-54 factor
MELDLEFSQQYTPSQKMGVSARLVAANSMLELSSQELQQSIAHELHDNPALELVDQPRCGRCGTELHGSICPICIQHQKSSLTYSDSGATAQDDMPESPNGRDPNDDEWDPLVRVASEQTMAEKLLIDMGAALPAEDMHIAEYLIGSLDDKGYLVGKLEDIAYDLDVDIERVRAVLAVLHAQEPVGIGARNLRECLLLQIQHLEDRGVSAPYVREIAGQFLTELAEHKFSRIAKELKIPIETTAAAWEFVKTKLNPHPAQGFSGTNASDRDARAMHIVPDVVISRGPEGFEVDVVESRRFVLRVSPLYTRLTADLHKSHGAMSVDERKHVQQYVGRAKLFISNINQRRLTMLKITTCIVDRQSEFLEHGVRHLVPLSRAAIAEQVGMHESTVSRATAQKFAMLPDGEVIPFTHFFTPSLSIKDILKEIIEDEGKPLTDSVIVERLEAKGIHIARRTVAKYRMQLAILPSGLR